MEDKVKQLILDLGADVCGIANINRFIDTPIGFNPKDIFPNCNSVLVFGIALPKGLAKVNPRLIYGYFNEESCHLVDVISLKASKEIEKHFGGYAIPLPCDGPYEYWNVENMEGRGLLSMRHAAVLAGLGTLGKSTLLLNEKYGNLLAIGAILTDLELHSDPLAQNICIKGCDLCIKNCPSKALDGEHTNQAKCRPNTYGKNARGFDTVNCNICRTICPMKFGKQ